jgi:hypothetical protein
MRADTPPKFLALFHFPLLFLVTGWAGMMPAHPHFLTGQLAIFVGKIM